MKISMNLEKMQKNVLGFILRRFFIFLMFNTKFKLKSKIDMFGCV